MAVQADQSPHLVQAQSTGQRGPAHCARPNTTGQRLPPNRAKAVIERDRFLVPVPHETVQVDQTDQAVTTQSIGQESSLQLCFSLRKPQVYPPCCACETTLRLRFWEPPPHDLEHDPHDVKPESWQWIGQAPSVQLAVVASDGHNKPPFWRCCNTWRLRVFEPSPHETEQALQVVHLPTSQSTGQLISLHTWLKDKDGHAAPPFAGWRMVFRCRS